MSSEEKPAKHLKVTDKRLFTSDGDLREEYKGSITPSNADLKPSDEPRARPEEKRESIGKPREEKPGPSPKRGTEGDLAGDPAVNPGTPFTMFLESLVVNAYMSLGMIRNPYRPETPTDPTAARQMIEIISMLQEKTEGNLTTDESQFLETHLAELKLAFVRSGQAI